MATCSDPFLLPAPLATPVDGTSSYLMSSRLCSCTYIPSKASLNNSFRHRSSSCLPSSVLLHVTLSLCLISSLCGRFAMHISPLSHFSESNTGNEQFRVGIINLRVHGCTTDRQCTGPKENGERLKPDSGLELGFRLRSLKRRQVSSTTSKGHF